MTMFGYIPLGLTNSFQVKVFRALTFLTLIGLCCFYAITSSMDINMRAWGNYVSQLYYTPLSSKIDKIRNTTGNIYVNVSAIKYIEKNVTMDRTFDSYYTRVTDTNTMNCSNINSILCGKKSGSKGNEPSQSTTVTKQTSTLSQQTSTWAQQTSTGTPHTLSRDDISQYLYVTTVFKGRLGNNMCIYAALLGIAKANKRRPFIRSGTLLENYFTPSYVNNNISTDGWTTVYQKNYAQFYASFFNLPKQNITLNGYFRSWKFLDPAIDEIRREFTFHSSIRQQREDIFRKLTKKRGDVVFVGVHVRRGDFLGSSQRKVGFDVPQVSYFVKAFKTMRQLFSNSSLLFIVASNDLSWCENNLKARDVVILSPGSPGLHLAILAGCDHLVISGGSYSWWAALLANGTTIYYAGYPLPGSILAKSFVKADVFLPTWIPQYN